MCKFDLVTRLFNQVSEITPEGCSIDFVEATSGGSLPKGWYEINGRIELVRGCSAAGT